MVAKDIFAKSIPGSGQKGSDALNSMIVPAKEIAVFKGVLTESSQG
jgi:hypothetical protein